MTDLIAPNADAGKALLGGITEFALDSSAVVTLATELNARADLIDAAVDKFHGDFNSRAVPASAQFIDEYMPRPLYGEACDVVVGAVNEVISQLQIGSTKLRTLAGGLIWVAQRNEELQSDLAAGIDRIEVDLAPSAGVPGGIDIPPTMPTVPGGIDIPPTMPTAPGLRPA